MKRTVSLLLATIVAIGTVSAQETEKKVYLPEAGDWAIGIDAKPILDFVGNLFNGNTGNTIGGGIGGSPTLPFSTASFMGKYMLTDRFAVKANFGVLINNEKEAFYIKDDAAAVLDPLSEAKVSDVRNIRTTGLSLMLGAEYRVGKKRIQGVFGGGLVLGVTKKIIKYSYGNEITSINQFPTTNQFNNPENITLNSNYRYLKSYSDSPAVFAGLTCSAGIECFVAPKIAIGAEVSLLAGYSFNQQTYTLSEGFNSTLNAVEERIDLVSPSYAEFHMGTENLGGSLYVSFYF